MILAVCGGYQLLGHTYQLGDESLPASGWSTSRRSSATGPRLIGNVAIEVELDARATRRVLAGFENHGGRTHLGAASTPLGRVLSGHGNNGEDGFEGVRDGNVIGTYLHGPLLPKNAWFADWLIATALALASRWPPLDDELEGAAHAEARRAAGDVAPTMAHAPCRACPASASCRAASARVVGVLIALAHRRVWRSRVRPDAADTATARPRRPRPRRRRCPAPASRR